MSSGRFGLIAALVFSIVVGCVGANLLSAHYFPTKGKLRQIEWSGEWIGINQPAYRAYFRRVIDVPFEPKNAWVAVASDDYALYVNGIKVSYNKHVANLGEAFQSKVSQRTQTLTTRLPVISRAPELRRDQNRERDTPIFVDISKFVRSGKNVLAIEVETADTTPVFSLMGEISNESHALVLNSAEEDWTSSTLPKRILGQPWNISLAQIDGWGPSEGRKANTRQFARIDPQIWTVPFSNGAISGPQIGNELRFRKTISGLSWHGVADNAWLRVRSVWPYAVFLDDQLVVEGRPSDKVQVYDVTGFLVTDKSHRTVRVMIPAQGSGHQVSPGFALDGFIDGQRLYSGVGWQVLTSQESHLTAADESWKPATVTSFASDKTLTVLNLNGAPDFY